MSYQNITRHQNNEYPYSLIDKLINIKGLISGHGEKYFSYGEWYFEGHWPGEPNVPGFIMTEAMVQMFKLTTQYETKYSGEKVNDLQFKNVRFLKKIYPGDCLELKSTVTYHKRGIVKGETHGYCEGEIACSMEITLAVLSELEKVQPEKI